MSGNAVLMSLVLILLAGTLALGAVQVATAGSALVLRLEENTAARSQLVAAADAATSLLASMDAEAPDSYLDPVYGKLDALAAESGTIITLTDLSSRFNLNSLRKNTIEGTQLGEHLLPGTGAAAFQQYREEAGFSLQGYDHYGDYFDAEALGNYLTCWGWWNINTADEFTLERIFALRTQDQAAAERFHSRVREQLIARRILSPDELEEFVGVEHFDAVFPAVNAEAPININTVDEWVLRQLFAYEAFRVVAPNAVLQSILTLRAARPIAADELDEHIPVVETDAQGDRVYPREENRLFAWLGDSTWFWEIRIDDGDGTVMTRVAARLPEETTGGGARRYVVVREEIPW